MEKEILRRFSSTSPWHVNQVGGLPCPLHNSDARDYCSDTGAKCLHDFGPKISLWRIILIVISRSVQYKSRKLM